MAFPKIAEASEEDEDSAEEIFSRPSTSRAGGGSIIIERATESDNISTDFGSILQSATSNKWLLFKVVRSRIR